MNSPYGRLFKTFDVGLVRVALWNSVDSEVCLGVTVERDRSSNRTPNFGPILDEADVTSAILGLNRAHDFLRNRGAEVFADCAPVDTDLYIRRLP